jgi:hypothetical protein
MREYVEFRSSQRTHPKHMTPISWLMMQNSISDTLSHDGEMSPNPTVVMVVRDQ